MILSSIGESWWQDTYCEIQLWGDGFAIYDLEAVNLRQKKILQLIVDVKKNGIGGVDFCMTDDEVKQLNELL